MITTGDKVILKGSLKTGVVISERLAHVSETEKGTYGYVRLLKVKFLDETVMEFEWTELKKV